MLSIGNDEIDKAKSIGDFILCHNCGKRHKIRYGTDKDGKESRLLSFYKCRGKLYLAGVEGKDTRKSYERR